MITLHRLGHVHEPFELNPDLIVTVEANPDTVVTLTTGTKIVVAEPADRVVAAIRDYRVAILSGALNNRNRGEAAPQPHAVSARRANQGLLVAVDRGDEDAAGEPEGEAAAESGAPSPHEPAPETA